MALPKLTIDQVQDHIDECCDGVDCKLRTAQAWADTVAAPGHSNEIRDLVMALHLADVHSRDLHESVKMLTTFTAAIVRREPTKMLTIERSELIERIERLVIEHDEHDESTTLALIPKPDGDASLS
jgi:hypothetical protein